MGKQLLPLCNVGRITTRDGGVGGAARLFLPFVGYWFADGRQILQDTQAGNIAQDQSLTMTAPVKPNVYAKECCGGDDGTGL